MTTEEKIVYTLGTSNRCKEEFVEILNHYKIKAVIDVRRFPTSKWEHFKKENLQRFLEKEGIQYFYLGKELGGYRRGGYEEHIQSVSFQKGVEKLEVVAIKIKSTFVCAERLPWRCHRRFIGKVLQERGWTVIHIIEKEKVWESEKS